jgi:ribosomal protein S18 acetylase RimI-like enzyme
LLPTLKQEIENILWELHFCGSERFLRHGKLIRMMIANRSRTNALRICRSKLHQPVAARKLHTLFRQPVPSPENVSQSSREWDFHLLESADLNQACDLIIQGIESNSKDYDIYVGKSIFDRVVIKLGMMFRSRFRLSNPTMALSSDSVILAATLRGSPEIVAVVEFTLLNPDGRIISLFDNPFRFSAARPNDQPYLFNLMVADAYKKKGLGKLLCGVAHGLVVTHWRKEVMYLHVYRENIAATALYKKLGYKVTQTRVRKTEDGHGTPPVHYSIDLKSWQDRSAHDAPIE